MRRMSSARRKKAEGSMKTVQKQNNSESFFFTTLSRKLNPGSKTALTMVSPLGFIDSLVGVQTRQGNARNHRENTTLGNFHFLVEDNNLVKLTMTGLHSLCTDPLTFLLKRKERTANIAITAPPNYVKLQNYFLGGFFFFPRRI